MCSSPKNVITPPHPPPHPPPPQPTPRKKKQQKKRFHLGDTQKKRKKCALAVAPVQWTSKNTVSWRGLLRAPSQLRTQTQPRCKTHRRNNSSPAAATLHGKTQGFVLRLPPQHKADATSCSHSNAICHHSFKKRIELRTQEQPLVAKHIGGTIRACNDRSRNRRTDEVPFIAGCSHFTRKKHGKNKVSCSGFLPNSPLPFLTTSHRHHFPSSPLPFIITSLLHHSPSSSLPFVTTSLPHHFPSSPPPFLTTPLPHHFPSSTIPIVTTSHRPHVPSSPPRHCQHPSSRSIPPLRILLLCIDTLCIVIRSTVLHHFKSQNSICPKHGSIASQLPLTTSNTTTTTLHNTTLLHWLHCITVNTTTPTTTTTPTPTPRYSYNYSYTTLHYTTLGYTRLYHATVHNTTLHYTTIHYITVRYTTLHYTTLHYTTLH